MISLQKIQAKRQQVNDFYVKYGFNSPEYNKAFDQLHDMNLLYMADKYRSIHGLGANSKTPYCKGQ
jgi:hypothetical protein